MSLNTRRPPRSTLTYTLLHYTTLFRSINHPLPPLHGIDQDQTPISSQQTQVLCRIIPPTHIQNHIHGRLRCQAPKFHFKIFFPIINSPRGTKFFTKPAFISHTSSDTHHAYPGTAKLNSLSPDATRHTIHQHAFHILHPTPIEHTTPNRHADSMQITHTSKRQIFR